MSPPRLTSHYSLNLTPIPASTMYRWNDLRKYGPNLVVRKINDYVYVLRLLDH